MIVLTVLDTLIKDNIQLIEVFMNQKRQYKTYTKSFKEEAVALVIEQATAYGKRNFKIHHCLLRLRNKVKFIFIKKNEWLLNIDHLTRCGMKNDVVLQLSLNSPQ